MIYSVELLTTILDVKQRENLTYDQCAERWNLRSGNVLRNVITHWRRGRFRMVSGPENNKLYKQVEELALQGYYPTVIGHRLSLPMNRVLYYLLLLGFDREMRRTIYRDMGMVDQGQVDRVYRHMRVDRILKVLEHKSNRAVVQYYSDAGVPREKSTISLKFKDPCLLPCTFPYQQ